MITLYNSLKLYSLTKVKEDIQSIEKILFSSLEDTKKKNQGRYYTPNYIVKYIVDSVIGKTMISRLNQNLKPNQQISSLSELKTQIDQEIALLLLTSILPNISVCDISMGWGVFLLIAFDNLLELYILSLNAIGDDIHSLLSEPFTKKDMKNSIVCSIITNNLYGTDLSKESVHLAKLKIIEKALKFIKKEDAYLPDPNFVVGNSLVGDISRAEIGLSDISLNLKFVELITKGVSKRDEVIVNEWLKGESLIHWSHVFNNAMKEGGFDVIVGNPPYINVKKLAIAERRLYASLYETYNPNGDISNIFWERSVQLCKKKGMVSFICPRYWLEGYNSNLLRKFLLSEASIEEIIDFRSNRSLFVQTENKLGIDTAIVTIQKKPHSRELIEVFLLVDNRPVNEIKKDRFRHFTINQTSLSERSWSFERSSIISDIEEKVNYRLGDDKRYGAFEGISNIGKGCSTGNNRIFRLTQISDQIFEGADNKKLKLENYEKKCLKILIKNSDIRRYYWKKRKQYWIFLKNRNLSSFPNIKSYLDDFKPNLERTQKKYNLSNFYDYAAYRSLSLIKHTPKIICPYQAEKTRFALIDSLNKDTINETDVTTIVIKKEYSNEIDWFYLLAVLNSDIVHYYTNIMNKKIYNLFDFRSNQVARIPIMKNREEEPFQTLVKYIQYIRYLEHEQSVPFLTNISSHVNNLLNLLVYEIYFQDKLSSDLNDCIRDELTSFPLNKFETKNSEKINESWEERIKEETIKKNIGKIIALQEIKEMKQKLHNVSNNTILL